MYYGYARYEDGTCICHCYGTLEEVCGNCWNHVDGVCTHSGNEEPDDQPACSLFES